MNKLIKLKHNISSHVIAFFMVEDDIIDFKCFGNGEKIRLIRS